MSALAVAVAVLLGSGIVGNLVRIPLLQAGGKSAPLLPLDLALACVLLVGAVESWRRQRQPLDAVALWGAAFLVVALVGVLSAPARVGISGGQLPFALAYLARWSGYFALLPLVGALLRAREGEQLVEVLRTAILLFAAFGVLQVLLLPGFAQLVYPESALYVDWDPQGRRLVSTFLDPNYAGVFVAVGVFLWLGRVLAGCAAPPWEGVLLLLALLLTLSRGALLGMLAGVAAMGVARGVTRRTVGVVAFGGVLLALAVPLLLPLAGQYNKLSIDGSALQRLLAWQRAATLLLDFPWLGIGFNTFGFVRPRYGWPGRGNASFGLDGGLLFIAALTGVIGVACFVGLLVSIVRSARATWRDANAAPRHRGVALAVLGSVVGVTVQGTFTNTLMLPLVMAPCWVLWSMPRVLRRSARVPA